MNKKRLCVFGCAAALAVSCAAYADTDSGSERNNAPVIRPSAASVSAGVREPGGADASPQAEEPSQKSAVSNDASHDCDSDAQARPVSDPALDSVPAAKQAYDAGASASAVKGRAVPAVKKNPKTSSPVAGKSAKSKSVLPAEESLSGLSEAADDAETESPASKYRSDYAKTEAEAVPGGGTSDPRSLLDMQVIDGSGAVEQIERSITGSDKFDINGSDSVYTLEDSVDKALRQNSTIRSADERVVQANAQYMQSKTSKNLKFVVGNKTTWQNRQTSGAITTLESLTNQLNASLQLLLTTFGSVEKQIAAAYLQIGVASLDAAAARRDLAYTIKKDFFNCLKSEAQVDVAKLNLQVCKKSLDDSKRLYRRGVMALYDVIQSDLQVTEAREQLEKSLSGVQSSNSVFLSDLEETAPRSEQETYELKFMPPQPIEVDPLCDLNDLQNLAARRRLELLSLDRSIEVARKMREAEESSNRPEVSLSADYIFSPGYRTVPCSIYQLNLHINWEAWDGGMRKQKLVELDSQIRALEASRDRLGEDIALEVEQAWINFRLSNVVLQTARKRVEAAWVYSDMARQRFLNGLGTSLEVQDSLSSLNDARVAYVVASYDRDLAFAAIEHSVGCDFPGRRLEVTPELMEVPDSQR